MPPRCAAAVFVMATFTGTIFSQVLEMRTGLSVVTPTRTDYDDPKPYRVIYLLHGLSDNHTCWSSNTQLTLFSDEYNVVFICPEVQRSFYADMKYGLRYFTYIAEELPKICGRLFPISSKREDTFVMGLSMGGYGALKCALSKPEQYAGCGAFSSACDLQAILDGISPTQAAEAQGISGTELTLAKENDLFALAEECDKSPLKPRIYMTCGTEDGLLPMNLKFRDFMANLDFDCTYQEWQGNHNWYFWNESLRRALAHFLQN